MKLALALLILTSSCAATKHAVVTAGDCAKVFAGPFLSAQVDDALYSPSSREDLSTLAVRWGLATITCTVQRIAAELARPRSMMTFAPDPRAVNAQAWLDEHLVAQ